MKDLLNKTHVYSVVRALDFGVKISKGWLAELNGHVERVIAANVEATKANGRVTLKSFVAATAKQAVGKETSAPVAENAGESKHRMIAVGAKMRRVVATYETSIENAVSTRKHAISGKLTVHTSLKDKPLAAMLERLVVRRLCEAGVDGFKTIKITSVTEH